MSGRAYQSFLAFFLLLLCGCSLLSGGSSDQAKKEVEYSFYENGIELTVNPVKELNLFKDMPHPLSIIVLQVTSPNETVALTRNASGLAKLLSSGEVGKSKTHFTRHFVQPGQQSTFVIDRAEETKFVFVVAGYADLEPGPGAVRMFPVPLKKSGWSLMSSSSTTPDVLRLDIDLGSTQITSARNLTVES